MQLKKRSKLNQKRKSRSTRVVRRKTSSKRRLNRRRSVKRGGASASNADVDTLSKDSLIKHINIIQASHTRTEYISKYDSLINLIKSIAGIHRELKIIENLINKIVDSNYNYTTGLKAYCKENNIDYKTAEKNINVILNPWAVKSSMSPEMNPVSRVQKLIEKGFVPSTRVTGI